VLFVIDSAYAEFVREKDYEDGAALVDAYPNVVTLRTFSKIHGLAALRLGWGYFPAHVVDVLNRVRGTFNVSAPAQAAGVAALQDMDFVRKTADMAEAGRAQVSAGLADLGIRALPSVTNFILAEFGEKAEEIRLALREKGVFVRQMGAYGLPRFLRVSLGTAEENEILLKALRSG
jgi:histidinol-phosphate aminotransferase